MDLLLGENGHVFIDAIVAQDLAKEVAASEICLKAVNLLRQLQVSANPLQNLLSCHLNSFQSQSIMSWVCFKFTNLIVC